ncbi:hypothetical protein N2152v2_002607 [Parachlorella kessleri]
MDYTEQEQRNLGVVKEYMEISYDPKRASADAVKHLVAQQSQFIAPSTFPEVHDCLQYAEDHGKLMKAVNNLHITGYDVEFAKGDQVCLRYTAEGSHSGEPHGDIQPTHKKAHWSAAALFQLTPDGKITKFVKEWNKLEMWQGLGWVSGEAANLKLT